MVLTKNKNLAYWTLALLLLGFAFWLRVESSQLRLFHADEGVQSYQTWRLVNDGEYRYDPSDHHGPFLYFFTKWMYPLIDDESGELNDAGMRRIPMFFSLATIAFGLWAFREEGKRWVALLWATIVASAPLCVIYGAYYVQEALLTFFTFCFLILVHLYWKKPSTVLACGVGFCMGLMYATKETSVLHAIMILAVGLLALWKRGEGSGLRRREFVKNAWPLTPAFLIVYALLFSSFFANPEGLLDGFTALFSYVERSTGQGHEKPFLYYFALLLPQRLEGVKWGESSFLLLSAFGLIQSFRHIQKDGFSFLVVGSGFALFLVYSIIPYKTPWLLLTPYCLLAYGVSNGILMVLRSSALAFPGVRRAGGVIIAVGGVFWLGAELVHNTKKAVFVYPSASRNPYIYMHTTPRYGKLLERLLSVDEKVEISIYSPDSAWPLPWHLRGREKVGYFSDVENYEAGGVDLFDTRLLVDKEDLMQEGGFWELHGLRPNTLLALRATEAIADSWIQANAEDR